MADPIRPSDQSGSSPISPQIKVPPPSATGGQVPPNLPVKEGGVLPPKPADSKPSPLDIKLTPPSSSPPSPSPVPPMPPPAGVPTAKTMPPPPGAKPETAQPAGGPGGPSVFKSSIRTMQEDILAVKKGQPPVGFQIEKESEKDIKPPSEALGPRVTLPPKPTAEIKLGGLEKARPLPGMRPSAMPPAHPAPIIPPVPPLSKAVPGLAIPTADGTNWKRLVLIVGGIIVIAFLVWFFVLRGPSEVAVTPTPTPIPTATPTPTPVSIEDSFSITDSVSIALGANFTSRFNSSINKATLEASPGEPALYTVLGPASGSRFTFSEFLSGLLIPAPAGLASATYENSLYLSAVYKSDGKDGYGFVVKLKDPATAAVALGNWESTMTRDLKDLFGYTTTKAASTTFLDNTYQGVAVRYRNFPDSNLTIDYAIIAAKDGGNYLLFANSREHLYAIIDKLK